MAAEKVKDVRDAVSTLEMKTELVPCAEIKENAACTFSISHMSIYSTQCACRNLAKASRQHEQHEKDVAQTCWSTTIS